MTTHHAAAINNFYIHTTPLLELVRSSDFDAEQTDTFFTLVEMYNLLYGSNGCYAAYDKNVVDNQNPYLYHTEWLIEKRKQARLFLDKHLSGMPKLWQRLACNILHYYCQEEPRHLFAISAQEQKNICAAMRWLVTGFDERQLSAIKKLSSQLSFEKLWRRHIAAMPWILTNNLFYFKI